MKEGEPELGGLKVPHRDVNSSISNSDFKPTIPIAPASPQASQVTQTPPVFSSAQATAISNQQPTQSTTPLIPQTFAPNNTAGEGVQLNNLASQQPNPQPVSTFQQPQPLQSQQIQQFPTQPPVISTSSDVVLSTPTSSKKTLILKILAIILAVVIVVGGIAAFFLISNANRQDFKDKAKALYSNLSWASYSSQCFNATYNFNNTYNTVGEFNTYINDCKQNAEEIQALLSNLKGRDNSPEYTEVYNTLVSAVNSTLVLGEDLDYSLNIYNIWHNWLLNTNFISPIQTTSDIETLTAPLLESSSEELVNYITGWIELYGAVTEAYLTADTYNFQTEYSDMYTAAYQALSNYQQNNTPDWSTFIPLSQTRDYSKLSTALNNFNNYIEDNYE